jgi:polyisoprenoid-binding protein YceI
VKNFIDNPRRKKMMKLQTALAIFAAAIPLAASAAPESYEIDPAHTYAHFSVVHLGMSTIRGRFDRVGGKLTLDRAAKSGEMEIKVETTSLNTGDAKHEPGSWAFKAYGPRSRDEMLRSADYFNVAEFPEAVFKSTKFNFSGDALESIDGTLTLLGTTKPVKLTVSAFRCGSNPFNKKEMCGADASTLIKRTDFGMKTALAATSDEVRMTFDLEAYKQ